MLRFKRLSSAELQELEPEFIHFLASQSITADDWLHIKENNEERLNDLLDVFSDMVFERVFMKVKYVEHLSPKDLMIFHCLPDKIQLVGIQISEESGIDLTEENFFDKWQEHATDHGVYIYFKERAYTENREDAIFQLVESGCMVTNEKLFNTLLPLCQSL
jgi:hypothetical protein